VKIVNQLGVILYVMNSPLPPALTDHATCPSLGLIYYWMYTNHRHELRHARKAWPGTLVDPCLLSGLPPPCEGDMNVGLIIERVNLIAKCHSSQLMTRVWCLPDTDEKKIGQKCVIHKKKFGLDRWQNRIEEVILHSCLYALSIFPCVSIFFWQCSHVENHTLYIHTAYMYS
jgi:hypothetical protein